MSFGASLLRALLSVALLINGSAQAMALTHSVMANHESRVATPPCHDGEDMKAAGSQVHAHRAAPATKKPDCCQAGACDCACSHGAIVTLVTVPAQARKARHAGLAGLPFTPYMSPALPRLIRPPIV